MMRFNITVVYSSHCLYIRNKMIMIYVYIFFINRIKLHETTESTPSDMLLGRNLCFLSVFFI